MAPSVVATGGLWNELNTDSNGKIDVTGHSLGGHLALAFNKLFAVVTGQVTVFNAPGFIDSTTNQAFFCRLGSEVPTVANSSSVVNVIADEASIGAVPWSAIAGKHSRPGIAIDIPIENQWLSDEPLVTVFRSLNHSQAALTDSLAVYHLLATLDPALATTGYKAILGAAAAGTAASYERIVDALEKLIGTDSQPMPAGNDQREALYMAITALHTAIDDRSLFGATSILPITTIDATSLVQGANGLPDATPDVALAYRYALKELNPFIVTGNSGLYAIHNLNGELEPYNPVDRTGALTSEWIADRAEFLTWKNLAYRNDVTALNGPISEHLRFIDLPQSINLTAVPTGAGTPVAALTRRILFGGDGVEVLTGGDKSDRLYGSGGIDYLAGKKDTDYLEGGAGRDVYEYNGYALTLLSDATNDGTDVIRDTDGKGVLRYLWNDNPAPISTAIADASVKVSATEWTSADGKFRYVTSTNAENATDLTITILGDAGGTMVVKDFRDGDFGIKLGTRIAHTAVTTSGGSGRNTLEGGTGNDLIEGGTDGATPSVGGDFIYGRAGDDDLYGNVKTTLQAAITPQGAAATPTGLRGDWLNGGTGDDYVIGYTGNDVVLGGLGADLLVGGAGDDALGGDTDFTSLQMDWTVTQGINIFFRVLGAISDENSNEPLLSGGADVLYGGLGNDYLGGEVGDDLLFGEQGNDVLGGGYDNDVLVGGVGDDYLTGDFGVRATIDDEPIAQGDDYLDGGAGIDWLQGEGGNDILLGGAGNDTLWGDASYELEVSMQGNDYLNGEDGNDYLNGGAGNDVLIGGRGVDQLIGGTGKDTYVFNRGDGVELITDVDDLDGNLDAQGVNTNKNKSIVVFGDTITRSQIKFKKGSLLIDLGDGDAIHLALPDGEVDPTLTRVIDRLEFADGTVMTFDDILAQGFDIDGTEGNDNGVQTTLIGTSVSDRINGLGGNDILVGLSGADQLYGGNGNDTLQGDAGSDFLDGGLGNDLYQFNIGDGTDTIDDADGAISLHFSGGLTADDLNIAAYVGDDGDDWLRIDYGSGDSVSIRHLQFERVGAIAFDNGSTISGASLVEEQGTITKPGTAGNDVLVGTSGNDILDGKAGSDQIYGGEGNDILIAGTDRQVNELYGEGGNDTLVGGLNNTSMYGGEGFDTYVLKGASFNFDNIYDDGGHLQLPAGLSLSYVVADQSSGDLYLHSPYYLDTPFFNATIYGYAENALKWSIEDSNGHRMSMIEFLANQKSPAGIDQVFNEYQGSVHAGYFEYQSRLGSGVEGVAVGADGMLSYSEAENTAYTYEGTTYAINTYSTTDYHLNISTYQSNDTLINRLADDYVTDEINSTETTLVGASIASPSSNSFANQALADGSKPVWVPITTASRALAIGGNARGVFRDVGGELSL
ncbi:MAG: hypothetical protein K2X06_02970 [Burkholderiales bacterium]|nr:hypothetical protein [Burkholderiales bacterium]